LITRHLNQIIIKTGEVILLSAGGILAYTIISKSTALSRIIFLPGKVSDIFFKSWNELVMTVGIIAQNTSNQKMIIKSLAANVYGISAGQKYHIGNISIFDDPIEINPNSKIQIDLDATLQLISVVSDLVLAFQNGNIQQTILLDGYANVDNYQIPINEKISVP